MIGEGSLGCCNNTIVLTNFAWRRSVGTSANSASNFSRFFAELADVPTERRQAKFVSTIVLLQHPSDPSPIIAQGECDGKIIYEEKGENGFGYDSLFFSPEKGCTFAELETVEKKKISHRAKALAVLKSKLSV